MNDVFNSILEEHRYTQFDLNCGLRTHIIQYYQFHARNHTLFTYMYGIVRILCVGFFILLNMDRLARLPSNILACKKYNF